MHPHLAEITAEARLEVSTSGFRQRLAAAPDGVDAGFYVRSDFRGLVREVFGMGHISPAFLYLLLHLRFFHLALNCSARFALLFSLWDARSTKGTRRGWTKNQGCRQKRSDIEMEPNRPIVATDTHLKL
ncbi:MAG: hypothetical protein C5S44_02150 [Candidatus Methanocomedens sp.]|nr:MAG: hypothetical protein C5S44_02150 [ANME-2 cluster archaeon]